MLTLNEQLAVATKNATEHAKQVAKWDAEMHRLIRAICAERHVEERQVLNELGS